MMAEWRTVIGLARSLVIYYGQFWKLRRLTRFYAGFVGPGDLAFDVGAHVGSRTRALLGTGARVVALEPQPACLSFLRRFVRHERLTIDGKAVGAAPGTLELHISSRHPTVTTLSPGFISAIGGNRSFKSVRWDKAAKVEVTTLDLLIAEHGMPRFCKIDVEGMEPEILSALSTPVPIVAFEYVPAVLDHAFACIRRLDRLGSYSYNLVVGERDRFESDEWIDGKAIADLLERAAASGRPGDVYARLSGSRRSRSRRDRSA